MIEIYTSKRFDDDLLNIRTYLARKNPLAAIEVVESIIVGVDQLAYHPEIAPVWFGKVRKLVVGHQWKNPYILPYIIRGEKVIILRVLHGRQHWSNT